MRELHHNTDEQAADYLHRAWQAVEAAGLPPELHPIAFNKACDWIAAKTLTLDPPPVLPVAGGNMAIPRGGPRH